MGLLDRSLPIRIQQTTTNLSKQTIEPYSNNLFHKGNILVPRTTALPSRVEIVSLPVEGFVGS